MSLNQRIVLTLLWLLSNAAASAQIVIDFRAKKMTGAPAEINVNTPITVKVINVNPLLYRYRVNIEGTPRVIDVFGAVSDILKLQSFRLETKDECDQALSKARAAGQAIIKALPQKDKNGKYESLSLEQFRQRWIKASFKEYIQSMNELEKLRSKCNAFAEIDPVLANYKRDAARLLSIDSGLETASTEITSTGSLEPNNNYTITIIEQYREPETGNEVDTVESPQVHPFSPTTSIFTLSAGILNTSIDARNYVRRTIPGATDTDPTQTVLEVEGANGFRPTGLALLNFQLPLPAKWTRNDIGLTLSAGPSVRIGSGNDASNLGFFAGPSLHLWRLIYLTPGWHIAEFADAPPGFYPGRVIPSNFQGDPQPLKRWTVRFAFGISFRAKDFSTIEKVKPAAAAPKPEAPKAQVTKPDAPKPQTPKTDPSNPTDVPPPPGQ